jgi:alanyl-tRNA synthetase
VDAWARGPCGPDTEVFVDTTGAACQRGDAGCLPGTCDCGRFVELWNNVFMTFQRRGGQLLPLPQANVDTGMGLERMLTVLNGAGQRLPDRAAGCHPRPGSPASAPPAPTSSPPTRELVRALQVLTDHLCSAVFILGDPNGVLPSNQGRGYVLRRRIRRACRTLQIQPQRWAQTAELVIDCYGSVYPELADHADRIANAIIGEGERFEATLRRATAKLRREIARLRGQGGDRIPAEVAFHLYDTDGLPIEVTSEIAREAGFNLDVDGFERLFDQHPAGLTTRRLRPLAQPSVRHALGAPTRPAGVDRKVDERGSDHATERGDHRHGHTPPLPQLAHVQLASDLETHEEEEEKKKVISPSLTHRRSSSLIPQGQGGPTGA